MTYGLDWNGWACRSPARHGPSSLSSYMLRHSYCTHLVKVQIHPFVALRSMGHKLVQPTSRYYHGYREAEQAFPTLQAHRKARTRP